MSVCDCNTDKETLDLAIEEYKKLLNDGKCPLHILVYSKLVYELAICGLAGSSHPIITVETADEKSVMDAAAILKKHMHFVADKMKEIHE